jgi:hypothetical protein
VKIEIIIGILFLLSQAIAAIYAKKKQLEKQRRLEEAKWQRNSDGTAVEAPNAEDSDLYDIFEEDEEEDDEVSRRRDRAAQPPPPPPTPMPPREAPQPTGVRFPGQTTGEGSAPFPIPAPIPFPFPDPNSTNLPSKGQVQGQGPRPGQIQGSPGGSLPQPPRSSRRGDVSARQPRASRTGFMEARAKRGPSERDRLKAQRIAERAASRAARSQARQNRGDRGSVGAKTARATKAALVAAAAEVHRRDELRTGHASAIAHAAALGASTAASVRASLGDPQAVRVAFVTAEILRPPHAG